MTKQINVQRALGELKVLDNRILRATAEGTVYTSYLKGGKMVRGNKNKEDFAVEVKSKLQSVSDLIAERRKLKAAIVQSNAVTTIEVAGMELTIAEAIEMKDSISLEANLVRNLRRDLAASKQKVEMERARFENELKTRIEAILGKDAHKDVDKADEVEGITKQFEKSNRIELFDPANIENFIEKKIKEIEDFTNNIDILILESNIKTVIEV